MSTGVLYADMRWALKPVVSHSFYRSCIKIKELFQAMFKDSNVAHNFHTSKNKVSYFVNFDLADYFIRKVVELVTRSA